MKPFKASINVSQVCREALENQVTAFERARIKVADRGVHELVQRFRREHIDREVDWEALGHEDARLWLELASLQHLETLFYRIRFKVTGSLAGPIETEIVPHIEGTPSFARRWKENDEWFAAKFEQDEQTNHYEAAKSAYDLGWFSYVRAVWDLLGKQIEADALDAPASRREKVSAAEAPRHLQEQAGDAIGPGSPAQKNPKKASADDHRGAGEATAKS